LRLGAAQVVECLPSKHRALSSNPVLPKKKKNKITCHCLRHNGTTVSPTQDTRQSITQVTAMWILTCHGYIETAEKSHALQGRSPGSPPICMSPQSGVLHLRGNSTALRIQKTMEPCDPGVRYSHKGVVEGKTHLSKALACPCYRIYAKMYPIVSRTFSAWTKAPGSNRKCRMHPLGRAALFTCFYFETGLIL
jgi:hypothetical protein